MKRPSPQAGARMLLLVLGVLLAFSQTMLAWDRGAAPSEVFAPALYLPVFVGAIFWELLGGLIAAASSSVLYAAVLADQSKAIGMRMFVTLLIGRIATFVFYALVIAIAARFVESRLDKLAKHDQIDDLTGLHNAKFFLDVTQLEIERSKRYHTLFCMAEVNISRDVFDRLSRRQYRRVIRGLAQRFKRGPESPFDDPFHRRRTDQAIRVDDGETDRFFVLMPETPQTGALQVARRIEQATRTFLVEQGVHVNGSVRSRTIAFPGDDEPLAELRNDIAEVASAQGVPQ